MIQLEGQIERATTSKSTPVVIEIWSELVTQAKQRVKVKLALGVKGTQKLRKKNDYNDSQLTNKKIEIVIE